MTRQSERLWLRIFQGLLCCAVLLLTPMLCRSSEPKPGMDLRVGGDDPVLEPLGGLGEGILLAEQQIDIEVEEKIAEIDNDGEPVDLIAADPAQTPLGKPLDQAKLKKPVEGLDAAVEKLNYGGPPVCLPMIFRAAFGPSFVIRARWIGPSSPSSLL